MKTDILNTFTGLILLLTTTGCGPATAPAAPPAVSAMSASQDSSLGAGDVFDIRIYGEKELSNTYRVAGDGTIDFPLIGTLRVEGLTPSQIKDKIETALIEGEFLKSPQVSILVEEYKSKKISVFGQVNKPGNFSFQEGMGVVDAISLAGGFTPMARQSQTTITRFVNGEKKNFVVDVDRIVQGDVAAFVVRPGDVIFVPERVF